eukprot:TRINITY_DN1313_c0_g1_i1.p1 TRINITY_DN1313_c0_g1~~TRINITY_DN1313_c0_g1_i1.p1  ORF type:complete len:176 (-),score=65.99 TRINITY_DN1313_c0_g1_i1:220-747(-)
MLGITVILAVISCAMAVDVDGEKQPMNSIAPALSNRAARLFFVSTTTSTLSTTTVCFYSHTTAVTTTCAGKKKRAIFTNPETGEDSQLEIAPRRVQREMKAEEIEEVEAVADKVVEPSVDDIESSQKEADSDEIRDAKFLLYWATTTSTSTSYTSTSTIATVNCTPASFTISVCG